MALYIFCDRVYENWPLYDILNEFQKGHSHMAVVIKGKENVKVTENTAGDKHTMLDIVVNSNSNRMRPETKGITLNIDTLSEIFLENIHIFCLICQIHGQRLLQ